MLRLSHILSYLTCPRLAYYRLKFGEKSFTEKHAVREIYKSLRRGFDVEWARERARAISENYSEDIFTQALRKFKFSKSLEDFKALEWDVVYTSEKLGVSMTIDEIVEYRGKIYPLFVSLNAPKDGVWLQDSIRAGIASLVANFESSLFYYAYSGEIRFVDTNFSLKRKSFKLIERLKMLEKGFIPERKEGKYCKVCPFLEDCKNRPETFASKFL
uniref:Dna2/Cas4 domain-containing protein n=1 Tax=Archaeoglobus fulgidus TaxID=2234 RepID=A0A7J2TGE6_ARCFL